MGDGDREPSGFGFESADGHSGLHAVGAQRMLSAMLLAFAAWEMYHVWRSRDVSCLMGNDSPCQQVTLDVPEILQEADESCPVPGGATYNRESEEPVSPWGSL